MRMFSEVMVKLPPTQVVQMRWLRINTTLDIYLEIHCELYGDKDKILDIFTDPLLQGGDDESPLLLQLVQGEIFN